MAPPLLFHQSLKTCAITVGRNGLYLVSRIRLCGNLGRDHAHGDHEHNSGNYRCDSQLNSSAGLIREIQN